MLCEGKPLSLSRRSPGSILPWAGLDEEFLVVCGGCKLIWALGMVSPPPITCRGEMDPPKGKEERRVVWLGKRGSGRVRFGRTMSSSKRK